MINLLKLIFTQVQHTHTAVKRKESVVYEPIRTNNDWNFTFKVPEDE